MQAVRAVTGRRVPVFLFAGGGAYLRLRVFGPEKYGGMGDRPGLIGKGNDQNSDEEKLQQVGVTSTNSSMSPLSAHIGHEHGSG